MLVATSFYLRFQLHALFYYKKCWSSEEFFLLTPTFIIEPNIQPFYLVQEKINNWLKNSLDWAIMAD